MSLARVLSRTQLGLDESKRASFLGFLESLHPDDREPVRRTFLHALSVGNEYEIEYRVLAENGGNISATARALNMHRRTLQRKLAKRP